MVSVRKSLLVEIKNGNTTIYKGGIREKVVSVWEKAAETGWFIDFSCFYSTFLGLTDFW